MNKPHSGDMDQVAQAEMSASPSVSPVVRQLRDWQPRTDQNKALWPEHSPLGDMDEPTEVPVALVVLIIIGCALALTALFFGAGWLWQHFHDAKVVMAMAPSVFKVRASSWGGLFDCAHRWEGEHILGLRKPSGLRAQLGTALHASTAVFDSGRLPGGSQVSATDAANAFVQTLHNPDREVDYSQDALTVRDAEKIGLVLHARYCTEISPQFTFKSVEQQLQPLDIDCGGGTLVRLTGTMDRARVADTPDGIVIPDVKSGSRVIEKGEASIKGRSPQIGTYQLMYEASEGCTTVGAQVIALHTTSNPQAAVSKVFDAKRVMVGTDTNKGLLEFAAEMFRSGLFHPNPQSILCSQKYCARWNTCNFHE